MFNISVLLLIILLSVLFGFAYGRFTREERTNPPSPAPPVEPGGSVEALIREGKMIDAIKLHRQLTGCGLREAKDAVDALRDSMKGM